MGEESGEIYQVPEGFREDTQEPLIDINLTDSTELWLIQLPYNHLKNTEFHGQKVSSELCDNGKMGTLECQSGKVYDVVNSAPEPDATVFLSSVSGSRVVGKIARKISLVRYPEPEELKKPNVKEMHMRSGSTMTNSSNPFSTPTHSSKRRSTFSSAGRGTSTHSSRHKSFSTHSSRDRSGVSEVAEPSKSSKRKHSSRFSGSVGQHSQDSGRGHSGITISGSSERSHQGKSKKIKREE